MRTSRSILALACLAAAALPAAASSFAGTSAGSSAGGTSATSGSTSGDEKAARAARADAARFVATDGAVRGALLEAAFVQLREHHPELRTHSDLHLAQAILTL